MPDIASPEIPPLVPLHRVDENPSAQPEAAPKQPPGPCSATVTHWLAAMGKLHRQAASSPEFYADAARFVVETIGLDAACVLTLGQDDWQIAGSCGSHPQQDLLHNSTALEQLKRSPITWFQPTNKKNDCDTRRAVVVAPVFDEAGKLIGAVLGARDRQGNNSRRGIRPLEARMVELLANSVAVGIARLQRETEASRARVLLEQAFTPKVADYLQRHPESLEGQLREVTMLFVDLRGYTGLVETLSPSDCCKLQSELMELLTLSVIQQQGVIVDYYGDGLLAFWNAPLDQPNHAELACSAALDMFEQLDQAVPLQNIPSKHPLQLGIGIHTGEATVGNAGTKWRVKYGPRGNAVNIAHRVEGATKSLDMPLLITEATQRKLGSQFVTLRVCEAKLPGLEQLANLFTVYPAEKVASSE